MIQLFHSRPETSPFAHCVVDGIFSDAVYNELASTFPECPPGSGPTGFTLYRGDTLFDDALSTTPAWQELFAYCNSSAFLDAISSLFSDEIDRSCHIARADMQLVDHIETRAEKEQASTRYRGLAPADMFLRFDFMQGKESYDREKHLDHRRRLATMLLYFDAPGPGRFDGGDLILHNPDGEAVRIVTPAPNRAVLFACSEHSWHSVRAVRNCVSSRRVVQVAISSCHDIWPGPKTSARSRASSLARRSLARIKRGIAAFK